MQEEPADVRETLKALFGTAFGLLSSLGVRDRRDASVHHGTPGHVCGFCGIERLSAPVPETTREHPDHHLAFGVFTLAGANLRNLAPIGPRCNSSHELDARSFLEVALAGRMAFVAAAKMNERQALENEKMAANAREGVQADQLFRPGLARTASIVRVPQVASRSCGFNAAQPADPRWQTNENAHSGRIAPCHTRERRACPIRG